MTSRISTLVPRGPVAPRADAPTPARPTSPPTAPAADGTSFTPGVAPAPVRLSGADDVAVQAKLEAVSRLLSSSHVDRQEEGRVLEILRGATAKELDALVTRLDLHALVEAVDDRLVGPDNRAALLRLLTKDRLGDLTVASRVALVTALQRGATDGPKERAIADVLLGTRGADLTALKNGIDAGDVRDLQQLVFRDLDDLALRRAVLAHFKAEATPTGEVKVLSDVDDTFFVNLKDPRYPKKTVYPGIVAFYRELDRGAAAQPGRRGDLTFVTARPTDPFGVVETNTKAMLEARGVEATVLTGSLTSNLSNERIAEKKFENFEQYQQLFPEYGFTMNGDSGQGDVSFGLKMRRARPDVVKAVFINDVVNTPPARRAELRREGVFLTDTSVGAATEAFRLGLIGKAGLARVVAATREELAKVPFSDQAQRAARKAELDRDVAAAERAMAGA
jgi:hypothetical protein